jgi:RNA polymerase sigma-70 factor (ECF subfamily)
MNPQPNSPVKELIAAQDGFVRALAMRLAPAPGLAEDIAQQVFLEFLAKEEKWDLSEDIKPLLAVMTRNVARRCWRERMHSLPEVQRELAEHICQLAESREVTWFGDEEKTILRRCLDRLPTKSRRLIQLHYYLDTTSVEIAQQMNMQPDAVRRALFRLREQLRKCVRKFLPEKSV